MRTGDQEGALSERLYHLFCAGVIAVRATAYPGWWVVTRREA
jgi:hypothetical protein